MSTTATEVSHSGKVSPERTAALWERVSALFSRAKNCKTYNDAERAVFDSLTDEMTLAVGELIGQEPDKEALATIERHFQEMAGNPNWHQNPAEYYRLQQSWTAVLRKLVLQFGNRETPPPIDLNIAPSVSKIVAQVRAGFEKPPTPNRRGIQ